MRSRRIPKYRHYKPKNLGLVVINGKQHYLGRYGSPESLAEYNRLIQEYLAARPPRPDPSAGPGPLGVDDQRTDRGLLGAARRHLLRQARPARPASRTTSARPSASSAASTATRRPATSARWR